MWQQIRRYVQTVRKYRVLVLVVTMVTLGLAAIRTIQTPNMYRASTVIEVQFRAPSVVPTMESGRNNIPYWSFDEFINTQVEIIKSTDVARRAISSLGLEESWTPENIRQSILIQPIPDSRLIRIVALGTDPEQVVDISMAVAQAFQDLQFEKQIRRSKKIVSWLSERIRSVHEDLRRSQQELFQYSAAEKVVSLEGRRNVLEQRLETTEIELGKTRSERLRREGNYFRLKGLLEDENIGYTKLAAFLSGEYSKIGESIQFRYSEVLEEIARKGALYGPEHPELRRLLAAKKELERQIRYQIDQIVERARLKWLVAMAEESALKGELSRLTDESLAFNDIWMSYMALAQDVDKNEKIYDILIQRLKEVDVTRNLQNEVAALVESATPNYRPYAPNIKLNLSVAFILGLVLGIVIAFIAEYYDPRIRFSSEFTKLTDVPVLVELPYSGADITDDEEREAYVRRLVDLEPASPEAELYRVLRTQIAFGGKNTSAMRSVVVTGVHPREGKSTVSSNLGISLAAMDRRVLLIDADIRRASLSKTYEVDDSEGLGEVLAGETDWQSAVQLSDIPNLYVLPAGHIKENPSELLVSSQFKRLLHGWQTEFDHVIIDMAPVLAVSDALPLAASVDGLLMVLKPDTSTREEILESLDRLRSVDANILGAVFNQVVDGDMGANPYYYYYRTGTVETEL